MNIFAHPDKETVLRILRDADLPIADITEQHLIHFFGCGAESNPYGIVGIEPYGEIALLRSLAVVPSRQGTGIGTYLVKNAEQYAFRQGVKSLYLLTTTAQPFFKRLGYIDAARTEAPLSIRNTKEFSGTCPVSSVFMIKQLSTNPSFHPTSVPLARDLDG
ncbi:MAG TPA: arsenic resistance N-acetyltransferase ArsN2 [Burkholderiales bacterium]|nr:arsenic resistance N-acetyltransferase ArsN2 [Burkholderiales bacterium]